MKKVLLSVFTIASAIFANAQCTPDAALLSQYAGGKLLPDTATFNNNPVWAATIGQTYSAIFNLKTITDTTVSGLGVKILKIKYLGMDGAPAGTTVVTDQPDGVWTNGGTLPNLTAVNGCATVTVPATSLTQVETFSLTLKVDLYVNIAGQTTWYSTLAPPLGNPNGVQFAGYKLKVGTAGIEELNTADVNLVVYPNPFSDETKVSYSLKNAGKVTLNVSDVTGKVVRTASLDAKSGINEYTFVKENLQNGIYFISLTSGENTITKKVSIQ